MNVKKKHRERKLLVCFIREPVKKKAWKIPHLGGWGPDRVIYHTLKKKKIINKVVFKMHFKPFQAILDHVFFNFFKWVGPRKIQKKLKKHGLNGLKCLKMHFKHIFFNLFKKKNLKIFHTFRHRGGVSDLSVEFSTFFYGFP